MGLDVSTVRAMYPALADGYAYLDGAAGTQLPAPVIDAIGDAHRSGLGNADGAFPATCTHGRMFASWSSRDTITSSPGRQSRARAAASR